MMVLDMYYVADENFVISEGMFNKRLVAGNGFSYGLGLVANSFRLWLRQIKIYKTSI